MLLCTNVPYVLEIIFEQAEVLVTLSRNFCPSIWSDPNKLSIEFQISFY